MKHIIVFGSVIASLTSFSANIVIQNLNQESSAGAPYYLVGGDVEPSMDTGYSYNLDGDEICLSFATNSIGVTNNVYPSKAGNLARKLMVVNQVTSKITIGYELDAEEINNGLPYEDAFVGYGCALPGMSGRDHTQYPLTNGVEGIMWYSKRITELDGTPTNLITRVHLHDVDGNEIHLVYGGTYTFTYIMQFPEDSTLLPSMQLLISNSSTNIVSEWIDCLHYNRNYITQLDIIGIKEFYYKDQSTSKSLVGTEVGTTKVLNAKVKMTVSRDGNNINFAIIPIGKDVCKNNPFKIQCKINGKWTTLTTVNANKSGSFTPVSGKGEITYIGKAKIPTNKFEDVVPTRQYRILDELNYVYSSLVVTDNL